MILTTKYKLKKTAMVDEALGSLDDVFEDDENDLCKRTVGLRRKNTYFDNLWCKKLHPTSFSNTMLGV